MKTLVASVFAIVALVAAATSFVVVDETEHAVVTQFGRPVAVLSEAGTVNLDEGEDLVPLFEHWPTDARAGDDD